MALRTTRGAIVSTLATASADFSLRHGLAGNAEALCYGAQVLQRECATDVGVAGDVAGAGIELYSSRGAPWPSGTHVGETPNLMLGLSGIGHFYLRLYRPSVPSVSILRKEAWL